MCLAITDPGGPKRCPSNTTAGQLREKKKTLNREDHAKLVNDRVTSFAAHPEKREAMERRELEKQVRYSKAVSDAAKKAKVPADATAEQRATIEQERLEELAGAKSHTIGLMVTAAEKQRLQEDAEAEGTTINGVILKRLTEEPLHFENKSARALQATVPHTGADSAGRPPSKPGERRSSRISIRLNPIAWAAVRELSDKFLLTDSDFGRAVATQADPRLSEGHLSSKDTGLATRRLVHFERLEAAAAAAAAGGSGLTAYDKLSPAAWVADFEEKNRPAAQANVDAWLRGQDKAIVESEDVEKERVAA